MLDGFLSSTLRIRCAALTIAVALLFSSTASSYASSGHAEAGSANATSIDRHIDAFVVRTMRRLGIHNVSLAVVQNGVETYEQFYGPRIQTERFEIGSVSKQFTAVAILLLEREGRLSIDDHVGKYVAGLTDGNTITLRELLDQTSGYPDYYATLSNHSIFSDTTLDSILSRYARGPLEAAPGTTWMYSNTGYAVLTKVIEKVSGMSYARFVDSRIFEPLGMHDAEYEDAPAFGSETVVGYERILLAPRTRAVPEGREWLNGAAGLAMSAHDLALWDLALLHGTLLPRDYVGKLMTEQRVRSGAGTGYGLGVNVARLGKHTIVSHVGSVQGFTSINAFFPTDDFAVAVLCNEGNTIAPQFLAEGIAGALGLFPASIEPPAGSRPIDVSAGASARRNDLTALRTVERIENLLRRGALDQALLTPDESRIATKARLSAVSTTLRARGPVLSYDEASRSYRGKDSIDEANAAFANGTDIAITVTFDKRGRIDDLVLENR